MHALILYFCICICSAQLSMFHMEKRSRNTLIIIIIIIINALIWTLFTYIRVNKLNRICTVIQAGHLKVFMLRFA